MGGLLTLGLSLSKLAGDSSNLQYQRNVNETLDDYQSRTATLQGSIAEGKARMQGAQMVAAQRLAYANSGVDEKSGTAAQVQANTAAQAELDAQTIKNNAARQAWGFQLAKGNEEQKYLAGVSAAQDQAASSIITGATSAAGTAMSFA